MEWSVSPELWDRDPQAAALVEPAPESTENRRFAVGHGDNATCSLEHRSLDSWHLAVGHNARQSLGATWHSSRIFGHPPKGRSEEVRDRLRGSALNKDALRRVAVRFPQKSSQCSENRKGAQLQVVEKNWLLR